MLKLSRLPISLLALTIATPVLAQPATTMPARPSAPKAPAAESRSPAVAPKVDLVDLNTATAAELKALPGITDSDASKIIQSRPYTDKSQLVSKKVVSKATYKRIKDTLYIALQQLTHSVGDLKTRTDSIESVILTNPGKALETVLLKRELDNQKESQQAALASLRDSVDRIYDVNKWLLGAMAVGIVTLAAGNLLKPKEIRA